MSLVLTPLAQLRFVRARLCPRDQAALWRAADVLAGRPGASGADAELPQALGGLRPGLMTLAAAPHLGCRRDAFGSDGSDGWVSVTGKFMLEWMLQ